MSTNFYFCIPGETPLGKPIENLIDSDAPGYHIGKRQGPGRLFMWAVSPQQMRAWCATHPDEVAIQDEYGQRYTARAFIEQEISGYEDDGTLVGQPFS